MKKLIFVVALLVSIISLGLPAAASASDAGPCSLQLPATVGVEVTNVPYPDESAYMEILITGEGLLNGDFGGWCLDFYDEIHTGHAYPTANVYLSYCDDPYNNLIEYPENIDLVNYILNQDYISSGAYTYGDVQVAIWRLIGDTTYDEIDGYGDIGLGSWNRTDVDAILADAEANGENFVPGCGDVVLVILAPFDSSHPEGSIQLLGVTVPLACGFEGLTPGFWKNHTDLWEGYNPGETVGDVFAIPGALGSLADDTLLDALKYKGGKDAEGMAQNLLRQAVAALLNAAHPDVNYPMDEQSIIDAVNASLATLDRDNMEALKDELDANNNLGGGIDAHGNPI